MNRLETAFTEGIIAFAATNIDDIVILLLFFSQLDSNFRRRHIVIGQYLGFTAIILASLPGFFGGLVIQREVIGLLGILPIAIGLKQLLNRESETTEVQTVTTDFKQSSHPNPVLSFLLSILHPQTYKVAAVTIANGGDNISIYIPLFAGHDFASLGVILGVFLAMVGVWCYIAYLLTRQATIANLLSRYGQAIVPFVLIGLGLFIMYERGTFNLIP
ncbi:cadmium resistance transporter [Anabaena catenula]|uniref:Cadmium resistance transporter n=1 Tax=Anabaena catenula FACHB-362 TaxID=2692877 RepID=A0ABR8J5X1_9NOST|nr:cadmium resistance transporter [Anabaena catenula]MBD2693254.1 cadmium resistance transporter [Anabaena catenula FACHB-362]